MSKHDETRTYPVAFTGPVQENTKTMTPEERALAEEDRRLIAAVAEGDRRSFNTLMLRHQDWAYNFAARYLKDRELARDVVQESFLRVFRKAKPLREGATFRGWLHSIVKKQCQTAYKKEKRSRLIGLESKYLPVNRPPSPEDALYRKELTEYFGEAVKKLPDKLRNAVLDFDVLGHTYEEMAEMSGCPPATIRQRVSRGRVLVKQYLEKRCGLSLKELLEDSNVEIPFKGILEE